MKGSRLFSEYVRIGSVSMDPPFLYKYICFGYGSRFVKGSINSLIF